MNNRVHNNSHNFHNDFHSSYDTSALCSFCKFYLVSFLSNFHQGFFSLFCRAELKEEKGSLAQDCSAMHRGKCHQSCHRKCPCSLIYKQKTQIFSFMWLLGDNYDKMKAVKFLPLFSALRIVPLLSKMEMRFHVAVIVCVPVSLSPSQALMSLFLPLPVFLSLSLYPLSASLYHSSLSFPFY